jgi:hypothetical protein
MAATASMTGAVLEAICQPATSQTGNISYLICYQKLNYIIEGKREETLGSQDLISPKNRIFVLEKKIVTDSTLLVNKRVSLLCCGIWPLADGR